MSTDNEEQSQETKGTELTKNGLLIPDCFAKAIDVTSGDQVEITVKDKKLVARGGWAKVYKGTIVPSGEVIAIKQVKETQQFKVRSYDLGLMVASRNGNHARNDSTRKYCSITIFRSGTRPQGRRF